MICRDGEYQILILGLWMQSLFDLENFRNFRLKYSRRAIETRR